MPYPNKLDKGSMFKHSNQCEKIASKWKTTLNDILMISKHEAHDSNEIYRWIETTYTERQEKQTL